MKILSVFDSEFQEYGCVHEGLRIDQLSDTLGKTPLTDEVVYTVSDPAMEKLPVAQEIQNHIFGGMPIQIGWCNGQNTKLNNLEYHRDSEVSMGTMPYILLLARQQDIQDGKISTQRVQPFLCPANTLIEVYATSLHYAPCCARPGQGFQVAIVLPRGTNEDKPSMEPLTAQDRLLWARNKWLLAHPESPEAAQGAICALTGENIDILPLIS